MMKFCLYILTLYLLCRLGHSEQRLAPVIPLHGDHSRPNVCTDTCYTQTCGEEAMRFVKMMNEEVDPCKDFYEFACGGYIKSIPIDEENSVMDQLQNDISDFSYNEVSADIEDTDLEALKKVKYFYQNCMDEALIERTGSRPLLELLHKLGGWPVLLRNRWNERGYNWMRAVYTIVDEKIIDYYLPASINVATDNDDSSKNTIKISPIVMNIDRKFFLEGQNDNLLKAYFDNMIRVVMALGARNDSRTLREMQDVLDFEVKLFNLTTPEERLVDMTEEKMNIATLSWKYPGIPWIEFINRILRPVNIVVDETEQVYITDPPYLSGAIQLARNTPKRTIANYLAWRVAQGLLTYLPKELVDIEFEFKKVKDGLSEQAARYSMCFEDTLAAFPVGVSAMFVRSHFDQSTTRPITELYDNLKSSFRKRLQQAQWMDEITRRAALEKLDAMNVTVGFSKELLDDQKVEDYYKDLQLYQGHYLSSAVNASYFLNIQNLKSLRTVVTAENKWKTKQSAAVMNAYYISNENNIEIPAGMIKMYYNKDRPQYVNYGAIGTIVGHEVVHGFDSSGRKYDKRGNQVNWWQPSAERKFGEKARCLIEQYNNFTVPEINMNVNGELTQGENIADNGGFRAAYLAYNEWAKRENITESCLPSFNYTPQQMFWISAAYPWCSKKLPESLRDSITDVHSPDGARITINLANIQEFARDFNCPIGSTMNPEKKCEMW